MIIAYYYETVRRRIKRSRRARGTVYSSYQNQGWDVEAYMAAQKEEDKQIRLLYLQ